VLENETLERPVHGRCNKLTHTVTNPLFIKRGDVFVNVPDWCHNVTDKNNHGHDHVEHRRNNPNKACEEENNNGNE
jgi:hypothetical protein